MSALGRVVLDDRRIVFAMAELRALGVNIGPAVMAPIGAMLESTTIERFDTGVAPDGEPWLPSLRAKVQGGKTLLDRGHLRDSVHYRLDGDAVEVGSAHESAGVHQFGATITAKGGGRLKFALAGVGWRSPMSVTVPARPFIGLSAEDRVMIPETAIEAVEDRLS